MNWDAIGAVAELVGAIGVIASLVYLAAQIRQGAKAQRAATLQAVSESITQAGEELARDERVGLFLRGMNEFSSLNGEERFRVHLVLVGLFRRFENLVLQEELGLVDSEIAAAFLKPVHAMASLPGVRDWWSEWRGTFSPRFASYVEEAFANPQFNAPAFGILAPESPAAQQGNEADAE